MINTNEFVDFFSIQMNIKLLTTNQIKTETIKTKKDKSTKHNSN